MRASERKPETLGQAQNWDRIKKTYLALGLCDRCAAQAAWGHQCGFSLVEPPCLECAPLVAALPQAATKGSGWRRVTGNASSGGAVATLNVYHTPPGSPSTPDPLVDISDAVA